MTITKQSTKRYIPSTSWREVSGMIGAGAFQNGWTDFDGVYTSCAYRIDSEGWVTLKGLVKSGTLGATIFVLPEGYRPLKDYYCKALTNNVISYLKVTASTGAVAVVNPGGTGSNAYASLNNACFPAWQNYSEFEGKYFMLNQSDSNWQTRLFDNEFPTGVWKRESGMYQIFGIHGVTTGAAVGNPTMPFQPYYSFIMGMADSTATIKRIDLSTRIGLSTATTTTTYSIVDSEFSLFELEGRWIAPTFTNSWVDFGFDVSNRQAPAGYWKDADGYVHLRGLVKNGTSATAAMFTLPSGYRPAEKLLFSSISTAGAGRIDITNAGVVTCPNNGSTTWTSLNGLSFYADGS